MRFMVTGAKGQLGSGMGRYFSNREHELNLLSKKELDITNLDLAMSFAREIKPEIIINTAAVTNVDYLESNWEKAFRVNAIGARNMAIVANEVGAKLLHISTDYVFDGEGIEQNGIIRPYNEFDKTNPMTVYGKSKLEGEKYVRTHCARHFIIRTAWLYGEGNNFITKIIKKIQAQKFIEIVNDQYGTPTSVNQLIGLINAIVDTEEYGLYHGSCEGQCTWFEYARAVFDILNIKTEIRPCSSDEHPIKICRPKYSVLGNTLIRMQGIYKFEHWKNALEEYIDDFMK